MIKRINRKKKKDIIKAFGRETYKGIKDGYLTIKPIRFIERNGSIIKLLKQNMNRPYTDGAICVHKCMNLK